AARAEGSDDSEDDREDESREQALALEVGPRPVEVEARPEHPDDEHQPREQEEDLDRVIEEEVDPATEPLGQVQARDIPDKPGPHRLVRPVEDDPRESAQRDRDPDTAARPRPADDAHGRRLPT